MSDHRTQARERIMDAARAVVAEEGVTAASARAIARRGGFSQSLIFYHFDSIASLLLEAFRSTSQAQVAKYRDAAAAARTPQDLIEMASRLHRDDLQSGAVALVAQLMASATPGDEVGEALLDGFGEWIAIVEETLARVMPPALKGMVPAPQAAYAISAMFLGIELMSRLDPQRAEAEAVFEMMRSLAQLAAGLLPEYFPGESQPAAREIERIDIDPR